MSGNNGAGVAAGEGGTNRTSGATDSSSCSILRKLQLSQACVDSGLDHLRLDAVHVAAQDVAERWESGERVGLMFMSLSRTGTMRIGRVKEPATRFKGGTAELGQAIWMMACDRSTEALFCWTDCELWAARCRWVLGEGQVLVQCLDRSGWQASVMEPKKSFVHGWSGNGVERRLIELDAWTTSGSMALN